MHSPIMRSAGACRSCCASRAICWRAAACLQGRLAWSRRQQALSWALRGASSLARLLHEQRCIEGARGLLTTAYDRFREGFDTADLVSAKALLATLN